MFDASKVKVSGEGVKPTGVLASLPVSFTIDSREAGVADVDVNIKVGPSCRLLANRKQHFSNSVSLQTGRVSHKRQLFLD